MSGLDNFDLARPLFVDLPQGAMGQRGERRDGAEWGVHGPDFRTAYVPDTTLGWHGQVVGLLQFDGYLTSDITYYESKAGLPNIPLTNVLMNGFSGAPSGTGGEVEVCLDIEMAMSMAPGLSKIIVYEMANGGNWIDLLSRMANDNLAPQLSCSWYRPGHGADTAADTIFQQMAAQGQTFFSASGDSDAFPGLIPFPRGHALHHASGRDYVDDERRGRGVCVGNGLEPGRRGGERRRDQHAVRDPELANEREHDEQSRLDGETERAGCGALTAYGVYVRADGSDHSVGGTSCAAPLWAGFTALMNQSAKVAGRPWVGFLNPAVYALGLGQKYSAAFHDTQTGNNTNGSSPTKFYAAPGYDLCTGWGTPRGVALINALVNPDPAVCGARGRICAFGVMGGPFDVSLENFVLTNSETRCLRGGWGATPRGWTRRDGGHIGPGRTVHVGHGEAKRRGERVGAGKLSGDGVVHKPCEQQHAKPGVSRCEWCHRMIRRSLSRRPPACSCCRAGRRFSRWRRPGRPCCVINGARMEQTWMARQTRR